jgi:hypothetical protein
MKYLNLLFISLVFATSALQATDYIQVKELMEKKEIKATVSFDNLSPILNDYFVGTAITLKKKEGQITGVALTTEFEGFVELATEKFSPLIKGSKKEFTIPMDGSWMKVQVAEGSTYTIRYIHE